MHSLEETRGLVYSLPHGCLEIEAKPSHLIDGMRLKLKEGEGLLVPPGRQLRDSEKRTGIEARETGVQIPALPPPSCVAWAV